MEGEITSSSSSSQGHKQRCDELPSSLPNDVVEEILLLLPVKSLLRFKSLSKYWRTTIGSQSFSKRNFEERSQSDQPKLILISNTYPEIIFKTICLESGSLLSSTSFDLPTFSRPCVSESCDGLFCLSSRRSRSIYVVNPATGWHRELPLANVQILMRMYKKQSIGNNDNTLEARQNYLKLKPLVRYPAFVKSSTDYKLVWLYNSGKVTTKCEVFDFRSNDWRYLADTPSKGRICNNQPPASANGSVYWFTLSRFGIGVVALDINTEKFRSLTKIHPAIAGSTDPEDIVMCVLDGRLCVSTRGSIEANVDTEIWRVGGSEEDIWERIYTISPYMFRCRYERYLRPSLRMLTAWKDKKIILSPPGTRRLMKYDPERSTLGFFSTENTGYSDLRYASYFQSLISHI